MGTPVVQARVVSSRVEIGANQLSVHVEIDLVRPLRGMAQAHSVVVHSDSTMLERTGPDGQTLRVSPLRDGSGLERDLVPGQSYFLILDAEGKVLIRAETLDSEARLRAAIGG